MISENLTIGRFNIVILFGHECVANPSSESKGFVKSILKTSRYDLLGL
jgi:hypothetical protein